MHIFRKKMFGKSIAYAIDMFAGALFPIIAGAGIVLAMFRFRRN